MAFRAEEAAAAGFNRALRYLAPKGTSNADHQRIERVLEKFVASYGPVVDAYPSWHPLVAHHRPMEPVTVPGPECGYEGLDHTVCFANAFLTCPYGDTQPVVNSVHALPAHPDADVDVEVLEPWFYSRSTTPVLVTCEWRRGSTGDHMIPKALAVPLMLEPELRCRSEAELAETWETMRPYFLGRPHGSRSSLFIAPETGTAMRTVWNHLIRSGAFGPIKT